uniref:Uncharacterized protein n=1 Tax=Panagrolaimus sp. JU765 TaxID=591449 RepID=A0AC34PW63_9BILA
MESMNGAMEPKPNVLCSLNLSTAPRFQISPVLVDDFILNRKREITVGRHKHKYLAENLLNNNGSVHFDLNPGFETYDPRPLDEGLDHILNYLLWRGKHLKEHNLKNCVPDG